MSTSVLWTVLGCVLLVAIGYLIVRMQGASLGPFATRLLCIGVAMIGYYGYFGWARHVPAWSSPVRYPLLRFAVPIAAALVALYCAWRVLQNWQSEMHGLLKGLLKLLLVLVLAVLARWCFGH
jgi:uncharacterized membrane protein YoaK (UPF0700 family)